MVRLDVYLSFACLNTNRLNNTDHKKAAQVPIVRLYETEY